MADDDTTVMASADFPNDPSNVVFVDQTPGKDNVSPEVQSPTAKRQVASVPHTTNHSPTVPTNIQEYNIDS
jgi:hypothetical protein